MPRILSAAVAGAVVYFVWQMATWMFLPIHGHTVNAFPDEDAIRDALTAQNLETGLYSAPFGSDEEMMDPESAFTKKHQAGPIFNVFYRKEGSEPMPPLMMVTGLVTDFLAALIVALLLSCANGCCASYGKRVGFVTAFGIFLALTAHVSYYNWMRFPVDYTLMFIVDAVVGWLLAGLAIAAIVKPGAGKQVAT